MENELRVSYSRNNQNIGAGNFTNACMFPQLRRHDVRLAAVCDLDEAKVARARLVLEELLLMQLGLLLHKSEQQARAAAPALSPPGCCCRR